MFLLCAAASTGAFQPTSSGACPQYLNILYQFLFCKRSNANQGMGRASQWRHNVAIWGDVRADKKTQRIQYSNGMICISHSCSDTSFWNCDIFLDLGVTRFLAGKHHRRNHRCYIHTRNGKEQVDFVLCGFSTAMVNSQLILHHKTGLTFNKGKPMITLYLPFISVSGNGSSGVR